MNYVSQHDKKAHQLLSHPETYPGLIERHRHQRRLLLWRYPSFEPYSAWAIFCVENYYWVRRVEWKRSKGFPEHDSVANNLEPYTYACEALITEETVNSLVSTLSNISLRPFQQPKLFSLDGTFLGVEVDNTWLSCRLMWLDHPSEDWRLLVDWFKQAVTEFEAVLPASTSRKI